MTSRLPATPSLRSARPRALRRAAGVSAVLGLEPAGLRMVTLASVANAARVGVPPSGDGVVPAALSGKVAVAVTTGGHHRLALTSDGQVTAWGRLPERPVAVADTMTGYQPAPVTR